MSILDLSLRPRRAALLSGHDTQVEVLVRLAAPAAPANLPQRAPLNLAIVIDRSGSMAGRPLMEAKRCAQFIVSSIAPTDRVSLVTFDDEVATPVPSTQRGDGAAVRAAIGAIEPGGSTALHAGWLAGAEQAAGFVSPSGLSRVLLLTDGLANVGERDPAVIAADCARLAETGVTTSTYGLGAGFDEALLAAMARAGLGNGYYGESAEDLMDPFREEFSLLAALCARKVRLTAEPAPGVQVSQLNALRTDREGRIILPDIAYDAIGWAMLRLTVPAALAEPGRGDVHVLTVHAAYDTPSGERRTCAPAHLRLPRMPAAAFESLAEDPEASERARELRSAELNDEIREAAFAGDWDLVDARLVDARREAGENQWLQQSLTALERYAHARDRGRLGKEALFQAMKKRSRLAAPDEMLYSPDRELDKAAYLRRKFEMGKKMPGEDDADGDGR